MFWAMMYLLFFSGSTAPEISLIPSEITFSNAIADPQRLELVLTIREEGKTTEQMLADILNNSFTELVRLSPQYEADSESFTALFAELDAGRAEAQAALLDQRFRLKEHMTEKEWNKVFRNR